MNRKHTRPTMLSSEWGRYLGTDVLERSTGAIFKFSGSEEPLKEIRTTVTFENHVTTVVQYYILSLHLASFDSRQNTFYLSESSFELARKVKTTYTPILEWFEAFATSIGGYVKFIKNVGSIKLNTKELQITENLCGPMCLHHPKWKYFCKECYGFFDPVTDIIYCPLCGVRLHMGISEHKEIEEE